MQRHQEILPRNATVSNGGSPTTMRAIYWAPFLFSYLNFNIRLHSPLMMMLYIWQQVIFEYQMILPSVVFRIFCFFLYSLSSGDFPVLSYHLTGDPPTTAQLIIISSSFDLEHSLVILPTDITVYQLDVFPEDCLVLTLAAGFSSRYRLRGTQTGSSGVHHHGASKCGPRNSSVARALGL